MMSSQVRKDFPILERQMRGKPLAFLDNGATSQKPRNVIDAIRGFYENDNSNVHRGIYELSEKASQDYEDARKKTAAFMGAATSEVVFTRGTTEAINLVSNGMSRTPEFFEISDKDAIVVTRMEHHSNFVPWQQLAREKGAEFRIVELDSEGRIDQSDLAEKLKPTAKGGKPKVFAFTWISNVLGTVNPVEEIAMKAKLAGANVIVDAAQGILHHRLDVAQWPSVDFVAFSAHKMCGPTGIGVLWGRGERLNQLAPYQYGGNMITQVGDQETKFARAPARFEAGTPNVSGAIGLGAAVDYLSALNFSELESYERELTEAGLARLRKVPGLKIFGPSTAENRCPVFSFVLDGVHPHDVATVLDQEGVAVRAGHHCAQPLNRSLGVGATTRASFAFYNTLEELDRLVAALEKCISFFGGGRS